MKSIEDTKKELPILKNDEKMYVYLQGSYFQQNNVLTLNNDHVINDNVINIYIAYKLDPIVLQEMINLQFKMLYLVLWKLLKILTLQNMLTKDMGCVLTKVVCLVKGLLTTGGTY